MPAWLILVLSLPTDNATARQRAWRALKASGAAVLRDGVYMLPARPACKSVLGEIAADVRAGGGNARLLKVEDSTDEPLRPLFDRSADYTALQTEIEAARSGADSTDAVAARRQVRRLRRNFEALAAIDFFPGPLHARVAAALQELEAHAARLGSPDEPFPASPDIPVSRREDFQGRIWATRRRPWVDRLASAWLIRRFIDSSARFLWLARATDCPADAVGFDFDGATFTHAGERVTFEVLRDSFNLEDAGLARMARVIHHLDAGGPEPPEAAGLESLLTGLRDIHADDDTLLAAACAVFDALHASFRRDATP